MGGTDPDHSRTESGTEQTVLVVDDTPAIADLYTTWLEENHDVRTAYSGTEALESADPNVDLIFLDRKLQDIPGSEVLERIHGRGLDCYVVMVTAADPEFNIVDMPFDEYLTKPVTDEDLETAVTNMQEREAYAERAQEYFALTSKKATLEKRTTRVARQKSEAYQKLIRRLDDLDQQVGVAPTEVQSRRDSTRAHRL